MKSATRLVLRVDALIDRGIALLFPVRPTRKEKP
jgi:hypothetical protein